MHEWHKEEELEGKVHTFTRKGIGNSMLVSTLPYSDNLGSISRIIQNIKVSVGNAAFSFFLSASHPLDSMLRVASTNSSLGSSFPFIVSSCFLVVG